MVERASIWRCGALALALLPVLAGGALAAVGLRTGAQLKPGALYTSSARNCLAGLPGTTCVFRFRASTDGRSLQFVGKTVIDVWHCNGDGGEALLGGKAKGAALIPRVKLRADGTLYGSVIAAPPSGSKYTIKVTGHVAKGGAIAVLTFHSIPSSGTVKCVTPPVTLTTT